jgi:hypothetical protein
MELLDYINWELIVKDYNLPHGDLSPSQHLAIEKILSEYIKQNQS